MGFDDSNSIERFISHYQMDLGSIKPVPARGSWEYPTTRRSPSPPTAATSRPLFPAAESLQPPTSEKSNEPNVMAIDEVPTLDIPSLTGRPTREEEPQSVVDPTEEAIFPKGRTADLQVALSQTTRL